MSWYENWVATSIVLEILPLGIFNNNYNTLFFTGLVALLQTNLDPFHNTFGCVTFIDLLRFDLGIYIIVIVMLSNNIPSRIKGTHT